MTIATLVLLFGALAGGASTGGPPPQEVALASAVAAEPPGSAVAAEPPQASPDALAHGTEGPPPGTPTISLDAAVRLALERNFALLDSDDVLAGALWAERTARSRFLPSLTPLYQRAEERSLYELDLAQQLPFTGGRLGASGRYQTDPGRDAPYPRTTDLRLQLTQPLLRGFGPNASLFELRNARRLRVGQERAVALARQRVVIDVSRSFYDVIAYRQLLDVARQSLSRTEALLRSSSARLEAGMASKLDVFRAQLQAAQGRDALVRSESSLASALERFRAVLALAPGDPLEPAAAALPPLDASGTEPVEQLVQVALDRRLELREAREQVDDARRAASLARQNLLPQLDLDLSFTQSGVGGSFGDAWTAGDRRLSVALSASYPLQQSAARADRALAQIQLGGRERLVRQREIEVEQEVRQARRDLVQIRKSLELQQQAVAVAGQQRRLAVLRYERGLGSNFDVVDAETSLVAARSALVQLTASWVVARLELQRATGTLEVPAEPAP